MKRVIKASKASVFMKLYNLSNPQSCMPVDAILDKYGDESEDIRDIFERASEEDQDEMIALLKPQLKLGEKGHAAQLYRQALRGNAGTSDYCDGIADIIHALLTEGLLDKQEFSAYEPESLI